MVGIELISSCSARIDPLVLVEKFSIDRTVFSSSGTDVPPDVSKVIGLWECF
jgi:hypothetical protein